MTLYQFNMLEQNDKYQTTWDIGKHIHTVFEDDLSINLYVIDRFFVEVHYNSKNNKIIGIYPFKSGHRLEKYTGDISIDDL